ncbi:extended synaptotagmin-2-B-like [Apostichopus japonicus]|uniref:extended synaptotagmin-2-B-like n=1 Tax=Stichopus japonicus TaxID=307972 RepID=UPI003AB7B412
MSEDKEEDVTSSSSSPVRNTQTPPVNDINSPPTPTGTELRKRVTDKSNSDPSASGKIQLTLNFDEKNQLSVTVHKALGLPLEDAHHPPDPYVRIYLLPDKSKSGKRKTDVIKETRDATYDEIFVFPCKRADLSDRTLDIAVKNDSSFMALSNPLLGKLSLNLGHLDLDESVTEWYNLSAE